MSGISNSSDANRIESRDAMMDAALAATQETAKTADSNLGTRTINSLEAILEDAADNRDEVAGMPAKKLEKRAEKEKINVGEIKGVQESVLVRKEDAQSSAESFAKRQGNREYRLDPSMLGQLAEMLGMGINETSTPEEIIAVIRREMTTIDGEPPDVAIVDKAFEFLIEFTKSQSAAAEGPSKERFSNILKNLESSKLKYFSENADKIQVAQKIIGAVDSVVETTKMSVNETLDHYRDIVHNPPDIQAMRKFYEGKGFKPMMLELKGLNNYLGGNLKRTHMEGPELAQLRGTVVKMQCLLGVFRLAQGRMGTVESFLKQNGILDKD